MHASTHSRTWGAIWHSSDGWRAHPATASISGEVARLTAGRAARRLATILFEGPTGSPYAMNVVKGGVTEGLMQRLFAESFLENSGRWQAATPTRIGGRGIDGLYVRLARDGRIRSVLVAEAKYGTSRLGSTLCGVQMSDGWVRDRLAQTATLYHDLADRMSYLRVLRAHRAPAAGTTMTRVPLAGGKEALVWKSDRGLHMYTNGRTTVGQVIRQAQRLEAHLVQTAEGSIAYRGRLFRFGAVGNRHRIEVTNMGTKGSVLKYEGRFDELPAFVRRAIRGTYRRAFHALSWDADAAESLVEKACNDASFFRRMSPEPRWKWHAGLDRGALLAGMIGGAFGMLAEVFGQSWRVGVVRWRRVAIMGAVGFVGSAVGHVVGVQVTAFFVVTEVGRNIARTLPVRASAQVIGGTAGGLVAAAVVAYGAALLGKTDWRTAHVQMVGAAAGTAAGMAVTSTASALVAAYGTAGTGTAISSLSGAAATNAMVAWFGFGGGMVVGGAVLTAGFAIVAAGIGTLVSQGSRLLDERERARLLEGRLHLVRARVRAGQQPEWTN